MAFDTHGASGKPWTGFDLDGTLAVYGGWKGVQHIGAPVKAMVDLARRLHDEGKELPPEPMTDMERLLLHVFDLNDDGEVRDA